MFKRLLKWIGAIIAVIAIAFAVFLTNLVWFRPWSLNLFYEKVFAEVLFDHPQLLSTLGLVEQFLENLKMREQKKILPPRFVVGEVLKEMTEFIGALASENILATSFETRAAKIEKLSDADRADSQARVETAINSKIYPAYQKLIDYFRDILPQTTTDDGVWKLPDGDAYYAYKLHENTTTTLKPDEVHELGLREVARIEGEMRTILDANGFSGQPIGEAMDKLAKDPRFLFPNNDKDRADALAEYSWLIRQATERSSKQLFLTTPRAKIEVRRVPEFKEATAPGAYYDFAAMDGTRPGIFFANLRDMNEVPTWSM